MSTKLTMLHSSPSIRVGVIAMTTSRIRPAASRTRISRCSSIAAPARRERIDAGSAGSTSRPSDSTVAPSACSGAWPNRRLQRSLTSITRPSLVIIETAFGFAWNARAKRRCDRPRLTIASCRSANTAPSISTESAVQARNRCRVSGLSAPMPGANGRMPCAAPHTASSETKASEAAVGAGPRRIADHRRSGNGR
jgi:hypothetical protein